MASAASSTKTPRNAKSAPSPTSPTGSYRIVMARVCATAVRASKVADGVEAIDRISQTLAQAIQRHHSAWLALEEDGDGRGVNYTIPDGLDGGEVDAMLALLREPAVTPAEQYHKGRYLATYSERCGLFTGEGQAAALFESMTNAPVSEGAKRYRQDAAFISAMKDLETGLCDLKNMSCLTSTLLEDSDCPEAGLLRFSNEELAEAFTFATYNLDRRVRDFRREYYAGYEVYQSGRMLPLTRHSAAYRARHPKIVAFVEGQMTGADPHIQTLIVDHWRAMEEANDDIDHPEVEADAITDREIAAKHELLRAAFTSTGNAKVVGQYLQLLAAFDEQWAEDTGTADALVAGMMAAPAGKVA